MERTAFVGVIIDPTGERILVNAATGQFPIFETGKARFFAYSEQYNDAIAVYSLGIGVSLLQCLIAPKADALGAIAFRAYADSTPATVRWIEIQAAPNSHSAVTDFLSSLDTATPAPWTRPHWYPEMRAWLDTVVEDVPSFPSPTQIKSWGISSVWRIDPPHDIYYFKAVPPLFAGEPRVTEHLSELFGPRVPEVAAIEDARHWMLLREFVGPQLRDSRKPSAWVAAARDYASMQVEAIAHVDGLLAAGCAHRPLSTLAGDFQSLADALKDDDFRTGCGLSVAEAESVRAKVDYVDGLCRRLAEFAIADTLIHGDLHAGNIVRRGASMTEFLYFDWTDAAISHPFFDLLTLVGEDWLKTEPHVREDMLTAYREPWTSMMSMADAGEAVDVALALAPAYHAVSYRRILDASAPSARWELGPFTGYYLRMLI